MEASDVTSTVTMSNFIFPTTRKKCMVRMQILYTLVLALGLCLAALFITVFFLSPSYSEHISIPADPEETWQITEEEEEYQRSEESLQIINNPVKSVVEPSAAEQLRVQEARQFEEERIRNRDSMLAKIHAKQQREVRAASPVIGEAPNKSESHVSDYLSNKRENKRRMFAEQDAMEARKAREALDREMTNSKWDADEEDW